jgi:hypothetical protein
MSVRSRWSCIDSMSTAPSTTVVATMTCRLLASPGNAVHFQRRCASCSMKPRTLAVVTMCRCQMHVDVQKTVCCRSAKGRLFSAPLGKHEHSHFVGSGMLSHALCLITSRYDRCRARMAWRHRSRPPCPRFPPPAETSYGWRAPCAFACMQILIK